MFHHIPTMILDRMHYLEDRDKEETQGKIVVVKNYDKLRQIPPMKLAFLFAYSQQVQPNGIWIEIGTSAGYSTLWLILACMQLSKKITTFELDQQKIKLAKETFALAQSESIC